MSNIDVKEEESMRCAVGFLCSLCDIISPLVQQIDFLAYRTSLYMSGLSY